MSWLTILRKREGFRQAFAAFDPVAVAAFGESDVVRLLADPAIVRHRGKILARHQQRPSHPAPLGGRYQPGGNRMGA
jgi:3-methyladenine DNA glycosylase Tag